MARYGAVCDESLCTKLKVRMGALSKANPREHANLFWAIRGGGGNFGMRDPLAIVDCSNSIPCCRDSCISQSPERRACFTSTATLIAGLRSQTATPLAG